MLQILVKGLFCGTVDIKEYLHSANCEMKAMLLLMFMQLFQTLSNEKSLNSAKQGYLG